MEKPAVLTNSTFVTVGSAISAVIIIVGLAIYLETRYAIKEEVKENFKKIEVRIDKSEQTNLNQDQQIQDLTKDNAVFKAEVTSSLKYLVDSVDELKKSVKELLQQRTIK